MRRLSFLSVFFLLLSLQTFAQKRIVTAGSLISEVVYALGHGDKIVATDRASKYPAALQKLPSIGYRSSISAEGILAQEPDLILLEAGYVKEEVITLLKATGIKTLTIKQEYSIESAENAILTIAEALGEATQGKTMVAEMKTALQDLEKTVARTEARPKVLCVYARGAGNMNVVGPDSFFSILELAGCQNAVPEISGYKPLNTEALIEANPDYILFFESGLQSVGGKAGVLQISGVSETTAGKKGQIIALEGALIANWGPRLPEAARQLFELTHPNTEAKR